MGRAAQALAWTVFVMVLACGPGRSQGIGPDAPPPPNPLLAAAEPIPTAPTAARLVPAALPAPAAPVPEAAAPVPGAALAPATTGRGPVTNLPIPRFVSLKGSEGNARRGPSLENRIDWVFVRKDMPLEIIGEYGHWRQVRDRDGATGWIHYSLLSGLRTVIVDRDMTPLRSLPEDDSQIVAKAKADVVGRLGECQKDWCRISAGGYRGWVRKTALWGVSSDETRN